MDTTTTTTSADNGFAFPEQRLLVTWDDVDLAAVSEFEAELLADGWAIRRISRGFATCDPDVLARHVFELLRDRVLELGFVDLDAE